MRQTHLCVTILGDLKRIDQISGVRILIKRIPFLFKRGNGISIAEHSMPNSLKECVFDFQKGMSKLATSRWAG